MARISVKELSKITGLAEKTIRNQVYDGSLPYIQHGRGTKILFDEEEPAIDELINGGKKKRSVKSRELQSSMGNENIFIGGAKNLQSKEVPAMAKKKNSQTWNYGQFRIQFKKGRFYVRYTDYDPEKGKNREFCVAATKTTNLKEAENFARGLTNDGWFIDLLNKRGLLEIPGVLEFLKEKRMVKTISSGNSGERKKQKETRKTFHELIKQKIEEDAKENFKKAANSRRTILLNLIEKFFVEKQGIEYPEDVTREDVSNFKDWLLKERPGLKMSSYNLYLTVFVLFMNWCESKGREIKDRILKKIKFKIPPSEKPKKKFLTDEQLVQFCDALPDYGKNVLELRWLCGDLREETLKKIKWSMIETEKGQRIRMVIPGEIVKNKEELVIPIHAELDKLLDRLKKEANGSEYVLTRNGKPIRSTKQIMRNALKKAGVYEKGIGFSIIRKTYATRVKRIYGGTQAAEIRASQALGHSDVTITKRHYIGDDLETKKQTLETMGSIFSGNIPGSSDSEAVN